MSLPDFLKKDSFILGAVVGISCPVILYLVLLFFDQLLVQIINQPLTSAHHYLYLLSTVANLFPIRQYLVKLKFEKTGLALLSVTALLILVYFFLFYNQ